MPEPGSFERASTAAVAPEAVFAEVTAAPTRRPLALGLWLPAAWIALVVVLALAAPVLPLKHPTRNLDFAHLAAGPSARHWLGTDELGRDILSRVIWGARVSLTVGVVSIVIGMVLGGSLGLVAGYYRGRVEAVIMWAVDIMLSFPALVLAIAVAAFLGQSLRNVTIAVAIVAVPAFARVARGATLSYAHREFVTAARALGATNRRIIAYEVLPNVFLPVATFALVVVAVAIIAEASLAFLGLSVPPPHPSWGQIIAEGKNKLDSAAHISLIPSGVMFLTVLSFNLVGDSLRARFDVRAGALR